uniref:Protein outspread-like isoform X1 n=1 Tax=Drosophila rhopaloa TaxID=1041015 RepID=A0A6P4F8G6_DRORH
MSTATITTTVAAAPSKSAPPTPTATATTNARTADCRKFTPNIFNKSKCSHCFRQREEHSAAALECNRVSTHNQYTQAIEPFTMLIYVGQNRKNIRKLVDNYKFKIKEVFGKGLKNVVAVTKNKLEVI